MPTSFVTDSGTAVPAANIINLLGTSSQGLSSSAAGDTITLTMANATAAATVGASQIGVAAFDSADFTVTAGFVSLVGSALGVLSILTDEGAPAVEPNGAGEVQYNGGSAIDITGQGAGNIVTIAASTASAIQLGVVELATDAESIAGALTDEHVINPSSLKAKLGVQTDGGILLGSGTTAAITATAQPTNGQLLIGSTGVDPVLATLADDYSTTVTNGAGTSTIALSDNAKASAIHGWNGSLIESAAVTVASDGATITCSVEKSGGGNLTVITSAGYVTWTTAPDTVALTPGTDTVPVENYVYWLVSTATLTASTVGWPATEHAPIATIVCQTAATMATNLAMKLHAWTDHTTASDGQGHIGDLNFWIRGQNATWISGVLQTLTITTNVGSPDNVIFTSASGNVLQLHDHVYPAFSGTPELYTVNDSVTPYNIVTDLNTLLTDSLGASMSGRRFSLVIWGVVSEDTADCKLMVNLPSGTYGNNNGVIRDNNKYADFSIPSIFKGTAFLIAELKLRHQTTSGGTWTEIELVDLRGLNPSIVAGGQTTQNTEFLDSTFRILDDVDETKEIAFQASGITTGTTRTLSVQDSDGTIAYTSDFSTALALGGTVANTVKSTAITSDPGAATDSYVQFDESTVGKWRIGNDATDDSYRISQGSALGTNDTFIMTSAGERTMPLNPAFLAIDTVGQVNATGNGTQFTMLFDDEIFDQGSDYNTGTGTFTAPITGRYFLACREKIGNTLAGATTVVNWIQTSNRNYLNNTINGAAVANQGDQMELQACALADMDAADTALVIVRGSNQGADNIDVKSGNNYFCGNLNT